MIGIVLATVNDMAVAVTKPRGKKSSVVIADATDRLLRATKEKLMREKGRIDYDKLAQDGYSAELIARLKEL